MPMITPRQVMRGRRAQTMSSLTSKMPMVTPRQVMRGHTHCVNGVVHLRDRRIVTCPMDGSLRLWDLESGTQIGKDWRDENDGVWSMALSPDEKTTASGGDDGKVRLFDVDTTKVVVIWVGHTRSVYALCWSADGERVVSGSWDGTARVWDVNSGTTDSSKIAVGGDQAVTIWDSKTGELLNTLKHHDYDVVRSLAWTSDRKKLISGSNGLIRIFDTATRKQIAILGGHKDQVSAISLSWNNRLLASASWDKTARPWNLDTNLPVGPPLQHQQDLSSATLSPDGKVLVTSCENGNVYTWDVHAILKEAGLEDLLYTSTGTTIAPLKQKASQDDPGIHHTPRPSLHDESFLEADATQCPDQFCGLDENSFFDGMEADVDSSPVDGAQLHSSIHALFARLSSFVHRSPPKNDAPDELQQPSTPSRLDSHALLGRLSSLFRSQSHTNEDTEPVRHPSHPHVVEVAAVRDKKPLVVARGPHFLKAKRAYDEQRIQSHYQAQASSSHTQPASTSISVTSPAPGAATTKPSPIAWWAQIVLFLCCVSPPHASGC